MTAFIAFKFRKHCWNLTAAWLSGLSSARLVLQRGKDLCSLQSAAWSRVS